MEGKEELNRSIVRPFIAIFLIVIWGVLVVTVTLDGGNAMETIPRELTVSALSYISVYSYIRSREKNSMPAGESR